jgi:transcriptional regulator with XRE-family HTH domain
MNAQQIGKALRKARGTRSIREAAPACGLSRHQVTSIESASTNYTIGSLLALCKELGCTITITKRTP